MFKHLRDRGLNIDLYPFAGVEADVVRFPMYDFGGRMTGYYQYRPHGDKKAQNHPVFGKYFSRVTKGEIGVFGLESFLFSRHIYLVEGLFKAATLHRLGYTAIHVNANSPKAMLPQLKLLNRPFSAIGDNDPEGAWFAKTYGGWQSPIDIDEMTDADVYEMLEKNSFLPA